MVDKPVAEPVAGNFRLSEEARGFDQGARCAGDVVSVRVAAGDRRRGQFQAFFHAVEAGGYHRRHGQVGVHVGARAAGFQPRRLRAAGNHPEAGGPVVQPPGRLDRRPEAIDQPLVAVDGRPEHRAEVHHAGDLAGDIAFKEAAHLARVAGVVEQVALAVRQALVDVAAATRQFGVRLGHEAGHDAKAHADFLGPGLEQDGAVGLRQRLAEAQGRFQHARAGFGVQAFDRDAEGRHLVHQRLEILAVAHHAQQRIAKHAGRQRLGVHALLGGPALRRFQEIEPLEFHAGHDAETHLFGPFQHPLERLARAERVRRAVGIDEFAQEKRDAVVPRHLAKGGQVKPRQRIGKAVRPARDGGVVVAAVRHVPAQHDVAKAEAAVRVGLGHAEELVLVQQLAAQHAVDVADRHLHLARARRLDRFHGGMKPVFRCGCRHAELLAVGPVRWCVSGRVRRLAGHIFRPGRPG